MTRKRSKNLFILFSIILVICLIAAFVNFTYPLPINGNYYSYSSFVSNLKLGEDIGETLRVEYRADLPVGQSKTQYSDLRTSTMNDLKNIIQSEGYKDVTVTEYGEDGILVNIGNLLNKDETDALKSIIDEIKGISFSTNSDGTKPFATGKHIDNVTATSLTNGGVVDYYVAVQFKDEYKNLVASESEGKTVYIHLGDQTFAQLDYSSGNIDNGVIYLQSDSFNSLLDAQTVASQINAGRLDLELTKISSLTSSSTYGNLTNILILIATVIFVLAVFVFLIVKYKHMGWLAMFNLLFFVVISLFLLQSIPLVHINFAGIIGMLICFFISADSLMSIIASAKRHYQEGTKLHICFKLSEKENLFKILILNSLIAVAGLVCLFMPSLAVQSFGWVAFVTSIVTLFTNLALMKLFIKMYLALNNTDGKKCNFHKGGKNA